MKKTILVTGGAGFVGSNLAIFLKRRLKDHRIICFDNLIRSGSQLNIKRLKDHQINFVKGDVRNKKALLRLPRINALVECSAEPSVLAGYRDPQYTIDTNLLGTINCLELAKRDKAAFVFLSTSRVYPIEALNQIPIRETVTRFDWYLQRKGQGFSYQGINADFSINGPRSLYGATKLASEHIIQEYAAMFSLPSVTNRLGVIAGPWQMGKVDQGIVGFWVAQHLLGGKLSYIGYGGTGKQVRDAVHVDDVCDLVLYQLTHLKKVNGKLFNAGGGRKNSFSLKELTGLVNKITGKKISIASQPKERQADIRIYITDNKQISRLTGWRPKKTIEDIIADTAAWITKEEKRLRPILK